MMNNVADSVATSDNAGRYVMVYLIISRTLGLSNVCGIHLQHSEMVRKPVIGAFKENKIVQSVKTIRSVDNLVSQLHPETSANELVVHTMKAGLMLLMSSVTV